MSSYSKILFDKIENTVTSKDAKLDIYKKIIYHLVDEGDSWGYTESLIEKHLQKISKNPQFSFNSEGGYE